MAEGKCCHLRATSVTALILLSTLLSLSLITTLPVSSAENIVNGLNSSIINEESFPTPDSNITNPQRAFDGNNASVHNQAHLVAKNCDGPGNCEAMAYSYIIYELSFLGVTDFVNLTFFYESYGEQDQFSDWRDPSGLIISFTVEDADGKTEVLNQSSTGGAEIILELYPGPFHLTQQRTLSLNISVFHTSSDYSADQANLRLYEVEAASADPPPNYNDSDGDGVDDSLDQCPGYDDNIDVDQDGIPDGCDPLLDNDGDGVANSVDECEGHDDSVDVDLDEIPDGCDDLIDDDNDGIANDVDDCPIDYFNWYSTTVTDYDSDGCHDENEDSDDDNDGVGDLQDNCQFSEYGWTIKYPLIGEMLPDDDVDGDGCHDSWEDLDLDEDGLDDWDSGGNDSCIYPSGVTGWTSTPDNDYDRDGCRDADEDDDDDNDYVDDNDDSCPTGIVGSLDSYTDHDGDGCNDAEEDDDDDNDTIPDNADSCPKGIRNWIPTLENDLDSDGCKDSDEDDDDDGDGVIDAWTPSWGCIHGTECELNFTKNGDDYSHVFVLQCSDPVTGQWCDETENSSQIKQFSITVNGISRIVNLSVSDSTTSRVVLDVYENDEVVQSITFTHAEPIQCIDVETGRFVVVNNLGEGWYSGCSGKVGMSVIEEMYGGGNVSFQVWGLDAEETWDGPWWLALLCVVGFFAFLFVLITVGAAGIELTYDAILRKIRNIFPIKEDGKSTLETDNNSPKQVVDDILSEDFSEESGYEKLHYFGMSQKQALEYYYNEKDILTLSYNEGSPTRLPYTSMFDNSIPRLKMEQFNLTPKGDSWENIETFSLSRDLRVFGKNENIQRIIDENGEISWDVETVGLHRTIGLNNVNDDGRLEVYKGNYEMGLKTNQIPDFSIPEIDNSPRKLDVGGSGALSPLNESMMYNQLGVDLLIRTSNNVMILTQRAEYASRENKKGVSIWARRWNSPCTFVFTNILQDSIGANPITLLSKVEKELRSRFEITGAEIESFEVHGISRSLIEAGTPTIHCMVNINLTHDEVKDRIIQKDHFLVRLLNPKSKDWRSQDNESSFVYIDGNDSLNALDQITKSCGKETSPILLASLAMWQRFEHNSTNALVPMERKNKDSEEVEKYSENSEKSNVLVREKGKGGLRGSGFSRLVEHFENNK